jgi:hypothetical protein
MWYGFEAAHVFPLQHESIWINEGLSRWVTNMPNEVGVPRINSTQNGLLLKRDIHYLFDLYMISINPDVSDLEHPLWKKEKKKKKKILILWC